MKYQPIGIAFGMLLIFFLANLFFPAAIGFLVPALLLFVPLFVTPPPVVPAERAFCPPTGGGVTPPVREPTSFAQAILATFFLDRSLKQFSQSVWQFLLWVGMVFPPYLVCAHFWMLSVFGYQGFAAANLTVFTQALVYQVLMVAFPEEFFFRGFLQTALNRIWGPKWRLFGVNLGLGWIATSLIFAFAHSVIELKWWHFSIFFPALLFGYLKERTGSITAPILFHAFSNSFMNWFVASYG